MSRSKEVLVGVVILAGIAVAVLGTLWLQGVSWGGNQVRVDAVFREVGQLMDGNSVKFRGVSIGRVGDIRVAEDGEAVLVTLSIDRRVQLPEDAAVLLSPESMFGDWQAEVVPRQRYPRFSFFEGDGNALPGHALPDISRLTATADEIAQNLTTLTERVELAFTEETAMNLAAAIDNIQDVSEGLSELIGQQANTFNRVATEVQTAANQLGQAAQSAEDVFADVDTILASGDVQGLVADARQAVERINRASGTLAESSESIESTLTRADTTFARLERISGQVESGQGALGRLLTDTTLALQAESALGELNRLLADLRENPGRYIRLSIF